MLLGCEINKFLILKNRVFEQIAKKLLFKFHFYGYAKAQFLGLLLKNALFPILIELMPPTEVTPHLRRICKQTV